MNSISSAYAAGAQAVFSKFGGDVFVKEAISRALLDRAAAAAKSRASAIGSYADQALSRGIILPGDTRAAMGSEAARLSRQHQVFSPNSPVLPQATAAKRSRQAAQEVYDKYNPGVPLGQGTIKREGQAVAQRKRDARADMRHPEAAMRQQQDAAMRQQQDAAQRNAVTRVESRRLANAPTAVRSTPRPLPELSLPEHSQVFTNTPYGQGRSVSDVFTNTPYIPTAVPRPMTGANTFNTARMTPARPTSAATQIFG